MSLCKSLLQAIKFQRQGILPQTRAVFKALADAIIPNETDSDKAGSDKAIPDAAAPESAAPDSAKANTGGADKSQEFIRSFGALAANIHEYQIWSLEHNLLLVFFRLRLNVRLANATAEMLNIAAEKLTGARCTFDRLKTDDRFRALFALEKMEVNPEVLPIPFRNNPGFVREIIGVLTLLVTSGYYSEWSGYGLTRLLPPEKRRLEHFPIGWKQVGYPGPAKGYHAFRGYLLENFSD